MRIELNAISLQRRCPAIKRMVLKGGTVNTYRRSPHTVTAYLVARRRIELLRPAYETGLVPTPEGPAIFDRGSGRVGTGLNASPRPCKPFTLNP